jgi:hypothetical protein
MIWIKTDIESAGKINEEKNEEWSGVIEVKISHQSWTPVQP